MVAHAGGHGPRRVQAGARAEQIIGAGRQVESRAACGFVDAGADLIDAASRLRRLAPSTAARPVPVWKSPALPGVLTKYYLHPLILELKYVGSQRRTLKFKVYWSWRIPALGYAGCSRLF